jgi:hypothetical protein
MFPDNAANNFANSRLKESILTSQCGLRDASCRIALSDFSHLRLSQFGPGCIFAICVSFLVHHILSVLKCCTKKKVFRIDALGIVASMADHQISIDRAVVQCVRETMSKDSALPSLRAKAAITVNVEVSNPQPTGISLLDFCPKSLRVRLWGFALAACCIACLTAKLPTSLGKHTLLNFKGAVAVVAIDGDVLRLAFASTVTATILSLAAFRVNVREVFAAILTGTHFSRGYVMMRTHAESPYRGFRVARSWVFQAPQEHFLCSI